MKRALSSQATISFPSRTSSATRVAQSPARPTITDRQDRGAAHRVPDEARAGGGGYDSCTIKLPRPSALTEYVGTLDTAGGCSTVSSRANREPWQGAFHLVVLGD